MIRRLIVGYCYDIRSPSAMPLSQELQGAGQVSTSAELDIPSSDGACAV